MPSERGERRHTGVLVEWNDTRGFGFIEPSGGGSRVFVHITSFPRGGRPSAGCRVIYEQGRDTRNRPRALQVRYESSSRRLGAPARAVSFEFFVVVAFVALLLWLRAKDRIPDVLVLAYALLSAVAVLLYGNDKSAAERGAWRTAESTLHTVALLGGWPGAMAARRIFRHKTTKQPFRTIFWGTVMANCAALAWFIQAPLSLPLP